MPMYKGSLELGKINKGMKLRFNLILKPEDTNFINQLIKKFRLNGNDYLKLSPHPYLTIDISNMYDKNEEWSNNRTVNLNQRGLFNMICGIDEMIKKFQIPNLYYYDNQKKLCVNIEVAKENAKNIICGAGKICRFQHCVVHDEESQEIDYEGVVFMINHPDNFCYLTIDELKFLCYQLSKIDLYQMSLSFITTALLLNKMGSEELTTRKEPILEKPEEELVESIRFVPIEDPGEIPNL